MEGNYLRTLKSAFTLIELLVVIAIIAVLAAILFPVFAQAREQGRKAVCISNQKQIALAVRLYTQDYDEGYPNTGDPYLWVGRRWRWPLMPYLGAAQKQQAGTFDSAGGGTSILLCPSDTLSGTSYDATSYSYCACFYHRPDQIDAMRIRNMIQSVNDPGPGAACSTQTEAAVAFPSQKGLIGEWYNSHQSEGQRIGYWGTLVSLDVPGPDRWQGARVVALADGHAKFIQARRMTPSAQDCPDIDLTPGGLNGKDLQ